jgi:bacterial/archaeal transporter family protein
MRTLIVLLVSTCAGALGDVCLTKGMKSIGEVNTLDPSRLINIGIQVFTNPYIWLGIFILMIFFGLYLVALSWADLSFVVPVMAVGYVLNAFFSWQLLGERISPLRWIGTSFICLGVAVVTRSEHRKKTNEAEAVSGVV